jgi:sugar lactone lactonase YvrE
MRISGARTSYDWIDGWGKVPDTESARAGFAHTGVVVTGDGRIATFHPGDPSVLIFDRDGSLLQSWDSGIDNAHGIAIVRENGSEHLWLAGNTTGRVLKFTLDGDLLLELDPPDIDAYKDAEYKPTSVAVNEERHGGNGDVWVADGYGGFLIHRYTRDGEYLSTLNGEEGDAGRFNQPHGIWIDRRKSEPEIYVADRANKRVQVYDLDGAFKRVFGSEYMIAPSGFVTHEDLMFVVEHRGSRLTVLDIDDSLVSFLGENKGISQTEGWPNIPREQHVEGKFNSPHGMAADADGNLYVAEWLIGGRMIKLRKM